jgi:hypothetical protein
MNCYQCLVEMGYAHQPAFALCQRCGAGVCDQHLVEVTLMSIAGMAGSGRHRHSLLCHRCHQSAQASPQPTQPHATFSLAEPHEQKSLSLPWNIWKRLRGKHHSELPTSQEVVEAAELFLKRQRSR